MNKYESRYQRIADKLIDKSFPGLNGKKIYLWEFGNSKKYSAIAVEFLFFGLIIIFKKCRKYSDKALKGLFVHELSHLEIIKNMPFSQKISYFSKWLVSKKRKADFETRTDKLAIEKGYDGELIQLNKESLKGKTKEELNKRKKKGYLTIPQIKKYMGK